MSAENTAKIAKAQPSRKGKKAWRKNIDITGVEDGLEVLRSEERVRGKTTPLEDHQLFTIDTVGDSKVKRQLAKDKPLKVDEILAERSAVPAVNGRALRSSAKPASKGKPSKYTLEKVEKIAKRKAEESAAPVKKKNKSSQTNTYDLWADAPVEEKNPYLEDVRTHKAKAPATMEHTPKALVNHVNVVVPDAGASYNPSMEEHQKLLDKAHSVELKKVEAAKKLDEQLAYRKELDDLAHELEEHNAHVNGETVEDEEETAISADATEAEKKKQNEIRKTRTKRNKERKAQLERALREKKQHERNIRKQIDKLEAIEEELAQRYADLENLSTKRDAHREAEALAGKKRLGKHYVQEMSIEVQLQDELSETLRQLKVIQEQFHL
ncbi:ribosome biogenesis protein Nop53/GLTSCR2 [Phycomyces blakesleeanus]|uniref:Ribosome biogenesis protein NOP53 n=1 Tax=Phycomyces blakesleeanus TaxID=4837 RepID=A0ABR3B816_PHYBL